MEQKNLDLARADFELACRERQKKHQCLNSSCEDCELKVAIELIDREIKREQRHAWWKYISGIFKG